MLAIERFGAGRSTPAPCRGTVICIKSIIRKSSDNRDTLIGAWRRKMEHIKKLGVQCLNELPNLLPLAALVYASAIAVVWTGLLGYSYFNAIVH